MCIGYIIALQAPDFCCFAQDTRKMELMIAYFITMQLFTHSVAPANHNIAPPPNHKHEMNHIGLRKFFSLQNCHGSRLSGAFRGGFQGISGNAALTISIKRAQGPLA